MLTWSGSQKKKLKLVTEDDVVGFAYQVKKDNCV
jgi:hypothetical protein